MSEPDGREHPLTPESIKKYRADLELTQHQMAEILGVSPTSLARWETGWAIEHATMLRWALEYLCHTEEGRHRVRRQKRRWEADRHAATVAEQKREENVLWVPGLLPRRRKT